MYAWTDFFYSKRVLAVSPLTPSNWCEWEGDLRKLIKPYACVEDILVGTLEPHDPLYSTTIDIELYFFLLRILDDELLSVALDSRARHGVSGSQLYQILKACFEDRNITIQGMTTAPSARTMPTEGGSASASSLRQSSQGAALGTKRSAVDDSQIDSSRKKKRLNRPSAEEKKNILGKLFRNIWPLLNKVLLKELSFYENAVEILTGAILVGQPSYDVKIDEELYSIIRPIASQHYEEIIYETVAEEGEKGSKLYAALERAIQLSSNPAEIYPDCSESAIEEYLKENYYEEDHIGVDYFSQCYELDYD